MARYQKAKLENDSSMNLFIYTYVFIHIIRNNKIIYARTKAPKRSCFPPVAAGMASTLREREREREKERYK